MDFMVCNRSAIHDFKADVPYVIISITEPQDFHPQINITDQNLIDALRIKFPDADRNYEYNGKIIEVMTEKDAEHILLFVSSVMHKIKLIVCQCDGGISRSSAVAAALGKILNNDDTFIFNNLKYKPNMHVYRTILSYYFVQKNIEI